MLEANFVYSSYSKIDLMKTVICCLRQYVFGPWLDIIYVENDDGMIHYVLQKQCCSDDANFDLPLIYHVRGHSLYFGRRYDVKIIDLFALFDDEEKFSKLSNEDAIRLCLLLSLEVIFMRRELVSVVDDVYLRMVNDLKAWNSFPWDMYNRVFLCIESLVDQSAENHTESIVMEKKGRI
nr:phospholipase-like, aminotransferase-like mobile domain protein [Tanacetum cinerariifolium]